MNVCIHQPASTSLCQPLTGYQSHFACELRELEVPDQWLAGVGVTLGCYLPLMESTPRADVYQAWTSHTALNHTLA